MASKDVIALANRIKEEFGIPADPEKFFRTYAGKNQRAAGACSWIMYLEDGSIGSVAGYGSIRKYISKKNILELLQSGIHQYTVDVYEPEEDGKQ